MTRTATLSSPTRLLAVLGLLLLAMPACDSPAMVKTLPPGVEPVRHAPEGEEAEALGEHPEEFDQKAEPKINLAIIPAEPTEPGKPVEMLNGLKYETLKPGTGEQVQAGQKATVHYVGRLADGSVFINSRERNEPYTFTIGAGEVIEGWERGIAGMKVGELRRITVPPKMAFKDVGKGAIPPDSTLVYEIELLGIEEGPAESK